MDRPNLILPSRTINNIIDPPMPEDGFVLLNKNINWFYENFIIPNGMVIIIIILFTLFLTFKYYVSQESKKYKKKFKESFSTDLIDEEINKLTSNHPQIMNPYQPYNNIEHVPEYRPLRTGPNNSVIFTPLHYDPSNEHANAGPVNFMNNRDYVTGIQNPYGWNDNFVSSQTSMNKYINDQLYAQHELENELLLNQNSLNIPLTIEAPYH
jgi:hypothetical protein